MKTTTTSRRNWIKHISAGMTGLLIAEQAAARNKNGLTPFNPDYALIAPGDPLKITKLEIIPVHSCRTIFIKMYTDAGITDRKSVV